MCGRITQKSDLTRLGLGLTTMTLIDPLPPRYNGAPGQEHWVIRQHPKTGERSLDRLWWGLIPHWVADPKGGRKPINAKAETVASLPTFRDAYARRRCLMPIDNFFEWAKVKGRGPKQPYVVAMKTGEPFARWHLGELAPSGDGRDRAHVLHHHHTRQRDDRCHP